MGTKENPAPNDCYANALLDEPMFALLARDPTAPDLVRAWAKGRWAEIELGARPGSDLDMVSEAFGCANAMIAWRKANDGKWRKATDPGPPQ